MMEHSGCYDNCSAAAAADALSFTNADFVGGMKGLFAQKSGDMRSSHYRYVSSASAAWL